MSDHGHCNVTRTWQGTPLVTCKDEAGDMAKSDWGWADFSLYAVRVMDA
jgi:hypothetical protein